MTLTLPGCSAPAEQPLLAQFFAASRLRDLTALQTISTIVFEPRVQGVVVDFDVVDVATGAPGAAGAEARDVTIAARVRRPDGRQEQARYVVTLTRAPNGPANGWGGWMVTAFRDGPGSPSTPRW